MFDIKIIVGIAAVIYIIKALRIIRQFERGLVETLGRYTRTANPGLAVIFPPFQTIRKVDVREQVIDVPPQEVITKDNAAVTVDAVIYFQVTDPYKVVYSVANFALAAIKLAQTNLRNIIGDMELDQTLTARGRLNTLLREALDVAIDKWGVNVVRVELQKIDPPSDITQAMSKQMKAEREKRAAILEAEGTKQSAILKAEGAKQGAILEAEGKAEAIKRVADAEKYQVAVVYDAIHTGRPTSDLLAIKYLEALEKIANGQATKIFLPVETAGLLGAVGSITEAFKAKEKEKTPNS